MNITIAEFRNDPDRVAELRKALEIPIIKEAMGVLDLSGPTSLAIDANTVSPTGAGVFLGLDHGWADYAKNLRLMAQHPPSQTDDANDYGQTQQE